MAKNGIYSVRISNREVKSFDDYKKAKRYFKKIGDKYAGKKTVSLRHLISRRKK